MTWAADGNTGRLGIPAQGVTVTYTNSEGIQVSTEIENSAIDIIDVNGSGAVYPASLKVKMLSLLSKVDFVSASGLLREGDFHLRLMQQGLPIADSYGNVVSQLDVIFAVGASADVSEADDTGSGTDAVTDAMAADAAAPDAPDAADAADAVTDAADAATDATDATDAAAAAAAAA